MFKFRKNKTTDLTIRAEDLQVNDRFEYDGINVYVANIIRITGMVRVTLFPTNPESPVGWASACLYNKQLISITR